LETQQFIGNARRRLKAISLVERNARRRVKAISLAVIETNTLLETLEGGLEPPTLWLTATRSNQLSYSSLVVRNVFFIFNNTAQQGLMSDT
jgi:hypothetical protein